MSARGTRYGLQGRYCFLCFFRPPDERKNPDWSDLMDYLIHPSEWSATCHLKPLRSPHGHEFDCLIFGSEASLFGRHRKGQIVVCASAESARDKRFLQSQKKNTTQ